VPGDAAVGLSCPSLLLLLSLIVQAPEDEPVWRQVLKLYMHDRNPDVAQQVAAALEH
jgi:hypothetical protein